MSETILIVEDEVKLAKVLVDYLNQSNYKKKITYSLLDTWTPF